MDLLAVSCYNLGITYERGIRGMNMKQNGICNACGRKLREENGILQEDALIIRKEWGYFSRKDLELHDFILCEDCYDEWVRGLKIPVSVSEKKEVLGPVCVDKY